MRLKRTHNCGELTNNNNGKTVRLSGWVENYRDHGGVAFIDLNDRWGTTQIVFHPEIAGDHHKIAHTLRSQDVITIEGDVSARPEGMANDRLPTGEIEVYIKDLELRLGKHQFLCDNKESLADIALLPFIRQFAKVERQWYLQSPYPKVKSWLNRYLQSTMFTKVMAKYPVWTPTSPKTLFDIG